MAEIKKQFRGKKSASKNFKIKTYLFSPSNEKLDYFLHFFSFFGGKSERGQKLKDQNENLI